MHSIYNWPSQHSVAFQLLLFAVALIIGPYVAPTIRFIHSQSIHNWTNYRLSLVEERLRLLKKLNKDAKDLTRWAITRFATAIVYLSMFVWSYGEYVVDEILGAPRRSHGITVADAVVCTIMFASLLGSVFSTSYITFQLGHYDEYEADLLLRWERLRNKAGMEVKEREEENKEKR